MLNVIEVEKKDTGNILNRKTATQRIKKLREKILNTDPIICHERAVTWTETYIKTEALPPVLRAAIALKETLENMSIHINDEELIAGNQGRGLRSAPLHPQINTWFADELDLFEDRKGSRFLISEETKKKIQEIVPYWKGKNVFERTMPLLSDEAKEAMKSLAFTCNYSLGKGTGHFLLNFQPVLERGFSGIKKEVEEKLSSLDLSEPDHFDKITFCKAIITICDAAMLFAERYAGLALDKASRENDSVRKKELENISSICAQVPAHPARNFYEALHSVWFLQLIAQIESDGTGLSLGRIDTILYPYYIADIEAERLTEEFAEELMDSFFLKLAEIIEVWPAEDTRFFGGHPISQTITLGGTDADGRDSTNELTYMCLDSLVKLGFPQPSICVRVHKHSPYELLMRCAEINAMGLSMPALYNDEIAIPALMMRGVKLEHARANFGVAGCVEMGLQGQMCHFANSGYLSFLKVLEITLNNGLDPQTGMQVGLHTGDPVDFFSFDEFLAAYKRQIHYFMKLMVGVTNAVNTMHARYVTLPFVSSFTEDCVGRLKEVHDGGALYNHDGPQGVGLADAADSLAVIKKIVYEEKELSMKSLIEALAANFEGFEETRARVINHAPKYGNNDPYVDEMARDLGVFFCREVEQYRNLRGGLFVPGLYSVSANVPIGRYVGASPNGRLAFAPVAEACSPTQGNDRNGPTQAALSVACLDHVLVTNGTQYNQRYHPSALQDKKGLQSLVNLVQTFFEKGGYHIQFNVVSAEKLRKAQRNPGDYRDLVVRVAGYSAFFTDLDESIQEDIIKRTEMKF